MPGYVSLGEAGQENDRLLILYLSHNKATIMIIFYTLYGIEQTALSGFFESPWFLCPSIYYNLTVFG